MTNTSEFDPAIHSHRRFNPLTNEYVLVSPHRTKRPWLGQVEAPQLSTSPQYDPNCYLCPRNTRASGETNPDYVQTYTFQNDFPAVLPTPSPPAPLALHPLFQAQLVEGSCDVLVFHRRHDLTLARLSIPDIVKVIDEWVSIYRTRGLQRGVKYIQIFENKGSIMGCSNPHPHGQVWSLSEIPTIPAKELDSMRQFSLSEVNQSQAPLGPKGRPCLLCEYAYAELQIIDGRIVTCNEHWIAIVPWWATWPYELLLLPHKRHIDSLLHLTSAEKQACAEILSNITIRYDNLFSCPFPYSMGIHQRPLPAPHESTSPIRDDMDVAHLHIHFSPPLLRSASVKKFLVGFELLAEAQRDFTPEQAAMRLRDCSDKHYLDVI